MRELLPELLGSPLVGEVLVIDDASHDAGEKEWRSASFFDHPKLRLIRNSQRLGLAVSLYEGVRRASGSFLLFLDSDGNHPPSDLRRLWEKAREGNDLVLASRYQERRFRPKRFNDLFSFFLNYFFSRRCPGISDWTHGYFLVRRALLEHVPLDWIFRGRGEYSVRLFRSLYELEPSLRVQEISTQVVPRAHGSSGTKTFRHGISYLIAGWEKLPSTRKSGSVRDAVAKWSATGNGPEGSGHSSWGYQARIALLNDCQLRSPGLDLGCGNGAFAFSLKTSGFIEMDGVDFSSEAILEARSHPYRKLFCADIASLERLIPAERYRTFLFFEVAQYLDASALSVFFQFAHRHALEDAQILCLFPHREGLWHRVRKGLGLGAEDYLTSVNAAQLTALAEEAGWQLRRMVGASFGAKTNRELCPKDPGAMTAHLLFEFRLSH